MSASPRPQYFVAREDGTLTPLVAVDELPTLVHIVGAPATISPAETQNMTSLGLKERSSRRYKVSFPGSTRTTSTLSVTNSSIEEIKRSTEDVDVSAADVKKGGRADVLSVENWRQGVKSSALNEDEGKNSKNGDGKVGDTSKEVHEDNDSTNEEIKSPGQAPEFADGTSSVAAGPGAGTKGTIGRKVYCTHWIRWGECDYTQQGCLYKHEMPPEDKLNEVGIATYPRWYRLAHPEKFGGITEVPEYHRRPGPAPTDQLWRGGSQARSVPPQSWDDFRQNATVQRSPIGNPAPNMTSPTFIISPYPGSLNPFTGYMPQQQLQLPLRQQQWNKGPAQRVFNMDPPFSKKAGLNSATNNNNASMTSNSAQKATESAKPQSHAEHQTTQPAAQPSSLGARIINTGSMSTFDQSQVKYTIPAARETTSSMDTNQEQETAVNGAHQVSDVSSPTLDGVQPAAAARNHSISSIGIRSDAPVNEAYRPLVPSTAPQLQSPPSNNGTTQQENGLKHPATAQAGLGYRRFFVKPGEPQYVSHTPESPLLNPTPVNGPSNKSLPPKPMRMNGTPEKGRKGKRGGHKAEKMDIGSLVDM